MNFNYNYNDSDAVLSPIPLHLGTFLMSIQIVTITGLLLIRKFIKLHSYEMSQRSKKNFIKYEDTTISPSRYQKNRKIELGALSCLTREFNI